MPIKIEDIISNVEIQGIENAIRASKFAFATDPSNCTSEFTDTVYGLASCPKGTGHDSFLNGIQVSFDLTLPIKVWTEFQRYKFADFVTSMSTMHRMNKFDLEDCYDEHVDPRIIAIMHELQERYNEDKSYENKMNLLYSNPVGMLLTARIATNYRQLKTMYSQRKTHELEYWKVFVKWMETLPMFVEFGLNK